jgi:hypothetical protein
VDDVNYKEHPDHERFERKWLATLMRDQIQQGIYVASSSGRYLGRMNRGWPDPDADATLQALKEAVAAYRRLTPAERRLSRSLTDADRLKWEQDAFKKPPGTLDLRISSRGYAFSGMTTFDQRHPKFYHLDRLWYKPSEWRAWLPAKLTPGSKTSVTGPLFNRIVLLSHMQAGQSAWWESHIRGGNMESEVVAVENNKVSLRITAHYDMRADSEWCRDTYKGRLLALAEYDTKDARFTKFELAMLGTHRVGRMMENIHVGSPEQQIAAYATLNPLANSSDRMIPQNWKYGYQLRWAQSP